MIPDSATYSNALENILRHVEPLSAITKTLDSGGGFFSAADARSLVDSPTVDISLKDGYAVRSEEIAAAIPDRPVLLRIVGTVAAGAKDGEPVEAGSAVRVLTGARIPPGADAVVSQEFTRREGDSLHVTADASPGRNILTRATDLAAGELVLRKGDRLTPGVIGLLAAGGISQVSVVRKPDVAIIATGDEVVAPGAPLDKGQVYASNLSAMVSWCQHRGFQVFPEIIGDEKEVAAERLAVAAEARSAVVTSGGSWTGDRDLVVQTLQRLGWKRIFHGVRMGPGKGSGFGLLNGTPIFILPGGPSANWIAFFMLVAPALRKMAGSRHPLAPEITVTLAETVQGREGWTKFILGDMADRDGETVFTPLHGTSRLKSVAAATAILTLPEDVRSLPAARRVTVSLVERCLRPKEMTFSSLPP